MKSRNTAFLLSCTILAAVLTGCSTTNDPAVSQIEGTEKAQSASETEAATEAVTKGKVHINVETVEISLTDLQAQNYTVPVMVTLEENAGVNYTEWGLMMDERCTFAVGESEERMAMNVYHAVNDEQHFLWTAWAVAGTPNEETGPIMLLELTLPKDAAAGELYTVKYADWSLADKAHVWSNDNDKWSETGDVTWVDGGVKVTE